MLTKQKNKIIERRNYESFLECIFDMEFNPNHPDNKEKSQTQNYKYILQYCNEYSYKSAPETMYHEWIELYQGNDSMILEMIMESYMRVIDKNGNVIAEHPEQRPQINIEIEKENK